MKYIWLLLIAFSCGYIENDQFEFITHINNEFKLQVQENSNDTNLVVKDIHSQGSTVLVKNCIGGLYDTVSNVIVCKRVDNYLLDTTFYKINLNEFKDFGDFKLYDAKKISGKAYIDAFDKMKITSTFFGRDYQ